MEIKSVTVKRLFVCGLSALRAQESPSSKMCSLNRTLSLSVFPREPAASLDTTMDYVKVGTTNVLVEHCYGCCNCKKQILSVEVCKNGC